MDLKDQERFWSKVARGEPGACWEWTACRKKDGYGQFWLGGTMQLANRVAWTLAHGEIPEGLFVCHHCDVPPCCNPAHLWLGTNADNVADRDAKGRVACGDRNGSRTHPERRPHIFGEQAGNAKLTEVQAREILALRGAGISQCEVAKRFAIHYSQVSLIWAGKRWAHLGTEILPSRAR